MLKRFQITDLFHPISLDEAGEWKDVQKEIPSEKSGIYKVRLENGHEIYAYFYEDKILWHCQYSGQKPSYWWSKSEKSPLYDVTHWLKKEDECT